jgi:hypothetical protein
MLEELAVDPGIPEVDSSDEQTTEDSGISDGGGATSEDQAQVTEDTGGTDLGSSNVPEDVRNSTWYKSMQADYTRKTQALAKEREALSASKTSYEWAENLQKTFETNPAQALAQLDAMRQHVATFVPNTTAVEDDVDWDMATPTELALRQQVNTLTQQLQRITGEVAQTSQFARTTQQKAEIDALRKEFGDVDESALLTVARDKYPGVALRDVFVATNYDKLVEVAKQDAYRNQQLKKQVSDTSSTTTRSVPTGDVKTLEDAFNLAVRQARR